MAAALVGLCVGALIGGLTFARMGTDTTATAFVRLENPADLTAIAAGASQVTPDNQSNTSNFVGGEIAYLSGEGFAQAVARKMAMDEPAELNIAQASESPVVTISNSSKSRDDAIRTVQVAIDLYGQELSQRVDEQLRTIRGALTRWEQTGAADPVRMQELTRIRAAVELQASEAATLLVVQPPTPNHDSSQQWLIGSILGGLVGGSVAVAILLARRRRSGRAAMTATLTDGVDAVLVPAVDLGSAFADDRDAQQARLARTLRAQCASMAPGGVLLVIGASPSSGSAEVAALLERGGADRSPSARVLHGGVVGDPSLTPDLVAEAAGIVLVARLDADTAAQAVALRSATAGSAAPLAAAFTYHGPGGAHRKKRTPQAPRQGVDDAERSMQ